MTGIYADQASTSFPKPAAVVRAVTHALEQAAVPGRGFGAASRAAGDRVQEVRSDLAQLFGLAPGDHLIVTPGATHALNMAIHGILLQAPGGRVVTSSFEHHAVMRPLMTARARGWCEAVQLLPCGADLVVDLEAFEAALAGGGVRLAVLAHVSNVLGREQPVAQVAALCRRYEVPLLLDASQSAGLLPVEFSRWNVDLMAFSGHKALFGPAGVGGLCVASRTRMQPLFQGGTGGVDSELEMQPPALPWNLEPGTLPLPALAGLGAGVRWLRERGLSRVQTEVRALTRRLLAGLVTCDRVQLYNLAPDVGIVSLNVEGWAPREAAEVLDTHFGVAVGAGLLCAPGAHHLLGTYPQGTLRISLGALHTEQDVDILVDAVLSLAQPAVYQMGLEVRSRGEAGSHPLLQGELGVKASLELGSQGLIDDLGRLGT